jgi:hypothetical protein
MNDQYGGAGGLAPQAGQPGQIAQLDVADVLRTTFKTMRAAVAPIMGCAITVVVPTAVLNFLVAVASHFLTREMLTAGPDQQAMAGMMMLPLVILVLPVFLALQAVGQGGIVYAVAEQLSGRTPALGQALRVGLSRAVWVFLTSMLVTLVCGVGMIACFVPGFIAAIFLCVAAPVCIVERAGPIASMQRSVQLTEGNRLGIFLVFLAAMVGWFIIAMCVIMPVQVVIVGGAAAAGGPGAIQAMQDPLSIGNILMQIVQVPVTLFAVMAGSTMVAVIYARLRGIRDGVDAQAIASVFA